MCRWENYIMKTHYEGNSVCRSCDWQICLFVVLLFILYFLRFWIYSLNVGGELHHGENRVCRPHHCQERGRKNIGEWCCARVWSLVCWCVYSWKETCLTWKETYFMWKEPLLGQKRPNLALKETHRTGKETLQGEKALCWCDVVDFVHVKNGAACKATLLCVSCLPATCKAALQREKALCRWTRWKALCRWTRWETHQGGKALFMSGMFMSRMKCC